MVRKRCSLAREQMITFQWCSGLWIDFNLWSSEDQRPKLEMKWLAAVLWAPPGLGFVCLWFVTWNSIVYDLHHSLHGQSEPFSMSLHSFCFLAFPTILFFLFSLSQLNSNNFICPQGAIKRAWKHLKKDEANKPHILHIRQKHSNIQLHIVKVLLKKSKKCDKYVNILLSPSLFLESCSCLSLSFCSVTGSVTFSEEKSSRVLLGINKGEVTWCEPHC